MIHVQDQTDPVRIRSLTVGLMTTKLHTDKLNDVGVPLLIL